MDLRFQQPVHKEQIETPSLLIDVPMMEANIRRMADFFQDKKAKLRPHAKTHKTPIIAHKQLIAGNAVGITVAKLGEAEVMAKAGILDILVANQVIQPGKIARLAGLNKHASVMVAIDSIENAEMLDDAAGYFGSQIPVLIEVNVGLNRCGVEWGQPALVLAERLQKCKHINFKGLMGYEGHAVLVPERDTRVELACEAMAKLVGTRKLLEQNGFDVEIVSGGGTGTYDLTGVTPGIDEVQAGSYVFMDSRYQKTGIGFYQALTLLATVISRPNDEKLVLDCGMKAITNDNGNPTVKDYPEWKVIGLHEEHAIVEVPGGDRTLMTGDKVELIPSHGCTTINLHDRYYAMDGDLVQAVWQIEGRGKFA